MHMIEGPKALSTTLINDCLDPIRLKSCLSRGEKYPSNTLTNCE
jgi:hypothetical protein